MKAGLVILLLFIFLVVGVVYVGRRARERSDLPALENVSVVDGKQIIAISAKGGYAPVINTAKAEIPTTLKLTTRGTFDCSSALTIPSIGYRANLPPSGETLVDVPPQKPGTMLRGICAMGMYHFTVKFL